MDLHLFPPGFLTWKGREYRCAIGPRGIGEKTREGDGVTPVGRFFLRRVHYRADRGAAPRTGLPVRAITREDGWCDDPEDSAYNRLVRLPYPASHEILWRRDGLYDVVIELGYNDGPVVPGKGSAIFIHITRPGYRPTEGCAALGLDDLLEILADCEPETCLRISLKPD